MTSTPADFSPYRLSDVRLKHLREVVAGETGKRCYPMDIAGLFELIDRLTAKVDEAESDRDRAEALAVRNVRALAEAQVENRALRRALGPFGAIADAFEHKAGLRSTAGELMSWSDHRIGERTLTVEQLQEAKRTLNATVQEVEPIEAGYTNYKGEKAIRRFIPYRVYLGANEWHPQPQVLIDALDCDKNKIRTFAASGFAAAAETV